MCFSYNSINSVRLMSLSRFFLLWSIPLLLLSVLGGCRGADDPPVYVQAAAGQEQECPMPYNPLSPDEEQVIVHKGTEMPFTGKYYLNKEEGVYRCRRCDAPLFRSEDKFQSGTGWPSFDDAIEGAVRQVPDADGRRTEIVCNTCGAHLGHVFFGESMTPKNVRHCVNSLSLDFQPAAPAPQALQTAVFAGGCFWGVEHQLQKLNGVHSVVSGYTGGTKENPTYREVCSGTTGHAEAVEVTYDPAVVDYQTLARLFFEIHDPTELNRQGPDVGTQYRSAVFYRDEEQRRVALELIGKLKEKGYKVVTTVEKAGRFYPAEQYHQDYYKKSGHEPYCHIYQKRF